MENIETRISCKSNTFISSYMLQTKFGQIEWETVRGPLNSVVSTMNMDEFWRQFAYKLILK